MSNILYKFTNSFSYKKESTSLLNEEEKRWGTLQRVHT